MDDEQLWKVGLEYWVFLAAADQLSADPPGMYAAKKRL